MLYRIYSDKNILPKLKGKILYQPQFDLLSLHAWISNQLNRQEYRVSYVYTLFNSCRNLSIITTYLCCFPHLYQTFLRSFVAAS
jgi:hypothetical protein